MNLRPNVFSGSCNCGRFVRSSEGVEVVQGNHRRIYCGDCMPMGQRGFKLIDRGLEPLRHTARVMVDGSAVPCTAEYAATMSMLADLEQWVETAAHRPEVTQWYHEGVLSIQRRLRELRHEGHLAAGFLKAG